MELMEDLKISCRAKIIFCIQKGLLKHKNKFNYSIFSKLKERAKQKGRPLDPIEAYRAQHEQDIENGKIIELIADEIDANFWPTIKSITENYKKMGRL